MKAFNAILVLFLIIVAFMASCSEQQSAEQTSAVQEQISEQLTKSTEDGLQELQAENKEIVGTVAQTDDGLIIVADSGNSMISGQDLSPIVGKNVKVTGTVKESVGTKIIEITSFQVMNE